MSKCLHKSRMVSERWSAPEQNLISAYGTLQYRKKHILLREKADQALAIKVTSSAQSNVRDDFHHLVDSRIIENLELFKEG